MESKVEEAQLRREAERTAPVASFDVAESDLPSGFRNVSFGFHQNVEQSLSWRD
jgi:hypothetical protein